MSVVVAEPLASWTTDISNSVRLAWKVAEILTANVATVCAADMYKGKGHTCEWASCIAEPKIVFSLASVIVLAALTSRPPGGLYKPTVAAVPWAFV